MHALRYISNCRKEQVHNNNLQDKANELMTNRNKWVGFEQ